MPWKPMTSFASALSMATAEASTPLPTYGTSISSSSPCTVPSSPSGPWRRGITTTGPDTVADVSIGVGDSDSPTASSRSGSWSGPAARALIAAVGELPVALAVDPDGSDAVLGLVDSAQDVRRGDAAHIVLGGLPAEDDDEVDVADRTRRSTTERSRMRSSCWGSLACRSPSITVLVTAGTVLACTSLRAMSQARQAARSSGPMSIWKAWHSTVARSCLASCSSRWRQNAMGSTSSQPHWRQVPGPHSLNVRANTAPPSLLPTRTRR